MITRIVVTSVAVVALAGAASATTTRTRPFAKPPYRHGALAEPATAVVALPTRVGPAAGVPDGWQPRVELERLAATIDGWIASSAQAAPLESVPAAGGPTVEFGCELDSIEQCDAELRHNVLSVTSGSRAWRDTAARALASSGAEYLLVLELQLRPHWIRQRGLAGRKEIRLGTEHVQPLPWLTSLDTPVWVVQLTGALVDREGRVASAGAEGMTAVRTPFRASVLGAERMVRPDEVTGLLEARREELPGRPLVWEEAARRLVDGLALRSTDAAAP